MPMRNIRVFIQPENVYDYFMENKEVLKEEMKIIAKSDCDDFSKTSFLFLTNMNGELFLSLEAPETIVDSEYCNNRVETISSVKQFLKDLQELSVD